MKKTITCPCCNGVGKLSTNYTTAQIRGHTAVQMKNMGYSYRKIQEAMDISSVSLVSHYIKQYEKLEAKHIK